MSKQVVNRGTTANDGTGEGLYAAFGKLNDNFTELYNILGQNADSATPLAAGLTLESATGSNVAGADFTLNLSKPTGTGVAGSAIFKSSFKGIVGANTVTMTIATPCVVTLAAHGYVTGQPIVFTTTGALPTGLTAGVTYYVIAVAGSTSTFRVATSVANAEAGTAINTTGSQSGTHTGTTSATVQNPDLTVLALGPSGLTGSQAISLLDLRQTWNTSGTVTGLKFNAVDIASNAASLLLDLQVSGSSKFSVTKAGGVQAIAATYNTPAYRVSSIGGLGSNGSLLYLIVAGTEFACGIAGDHFFVGLNDDVRLYRDAAAVLASRNSTNAQTYRLYRTYTDASNYERLALQSGSGYFELACETAGTGADDLDLRLTPAGTGKVMFGAHSAIAAETVTGYITIKDAGGTTRKLAVVS